MGKIIKNNMTSHGSTDDSGSLDSSEKRELAEELGLDIVEEGKNLVLTSAEVTMLHGPKNYIMNIPALKQAKKDKE